jgi:hypothetical protein
MHCLLCHEKIPRLRAWTGKSEFCCDEHSDLYKKQTMERLLVDESAASEPAPALPIRSNESALVDHVLLGVRSSGNRPLDDSSDSGEVDELWKLADKLGDQEDQVETEATSAVADEPTTSSDAGEDALAALLALVEESGAAGVASPAPSKPELPAASAESSSDEVAQAEAPPSAVASDSGPSDFTDAPELQLDALEQAESVAALAPPELDAAFEELSPVDLAPPEPEIAELLADDLTPPELASFEMPVKKTEAAPQKPKVAARAVAAASRKAPKLTGSVTMRELNPAPFLPDGGYPLKPWTDALELAGPDRVSPLDPIKSLGLRKSSLNGTASGTFAPVVFRPTERTAPISFLVPEPEATKPIANPAAVLAPSESLAWPVELHAALRTAEMKFQSPIGDVAMDGAPTIPALPALSAEFLRYVAFDGSVVEPQGSIILSPPEKDVIASGSAEEDSDHIYATSVGTGQSEEADGGERNDVADLF